MNTSLVASLDKKLDVRAHEGNSHGNIGTVGKDKLGVVTELLNVREDVIPSTAVKTRRVVTEFVDDFVHFKDSKDSLYKNSTSDSTTRNTNPVLRNVENVVPKTSLKVRLHLGKVEVRTKALGNSLLGVVIEVKTKSKIPPEMGSPSTRK